MPARQEIRGIREAVIDHAANGKQSPDLFENNFKNFPDAILIGRSYTGNGRL